jgi:hypothetical protein
MVRIEIRDTDNSLIGELELTGGDSPLVLNKKVIDYEGLSKRGGVYSVDFETNLTANNSQLYKAIHNANLKDVNNFFKRKEALIIANDVVIEKGYLQIRNIDFKNDVNYLMCIFYGGNLDWVTQMQHLTLADLSYVDSSFTYDIDTITNSWTNTADNSDYVFAFINRGRDFNYDLFTDAIVEDIYGYADAVKRDVNEFKPDLFLNRVLKYAFAECGFTLKLDGATNTNFFAGSVAKSLIIPYFGERWKLDSSATDDRLIDVTGFGGYSIEGRDARLQNDFSILECEVINETTINRLILQTATKDDNAQYDSTTGIWDFTNDYGDWNYTVSLSISTITSPFQQIEQGDILKLMLFSKNEAVIEFTLPETSKWNNTFNLNGTIRGSYSPDFFTSDFFYFVVEKQGLGENANCNINRPYLNFAVLSTTNIKVQPATVISAFSPVQLADVLDDTVSVLSIINDITKMFNLVWETNPFTKEVVALPRDNYYLDLIQSIDVSDLIDLSSGYELTDMKSLVERYLKLSYLEDSADGRIKKWNESLPPEDEWAALYKLDLGTDFDNDNTKELKTDVICSSLHNGNYPYTPITTAIFTEPVVSVYSTKHGVRLLSYSRGTQKEIDGTGQRVMYVDYFLENPTGTPKGISTTNIPAALDRWVRSPLDGNNTVLAFSNATLCWHDNTPQNGLYTTYWKKSIQEYAQMKKLTLTMVISLNFWHKLNFRKGFYINQPEDISGYWRVGEILGFKPDKEVQLCKVVLYKAADPNGVGTIPTPRLPRQPAIETIDEEVDEPTFVTTTKR